MDEDHKRKIAEALKRSWTPERREALRQKRLGAANPFFGKSHTEETRALFRENASGESNPFHGKTHDGATREVMSKKKKNRAIRLYKYGITDEEYADKLASGLKWCYGHKAFLPSEQFSPDSKGVCRECQAANSRQWRTKNADRSRELMKAHYERNKDKLRELASAAYHALSAEVKIQRARKNSLTTKYGITEEWYVMQLAKQGGGCAICGKHSPMGKYGKYMAVDHDHSTGKPRGVLCHKCNTGIGWLDKSEWVPKALQYLQQYS